MRAFDTHSEASPASSRGIYVLRTAVAGISLAICVAAAVLWARSTIEMDQLRSADPVRQTTLISANGEICVQVVTVMLPSFETGLSVGHAMPSQYRPSLKWEVAGFGSGHDSVPTLDGPIVSDTYMAPLWLVVVLFAMPPVLIWDRRLLGSQPPAPPAFPSPAQAISGAPARAGFVSRILQFVQPGGGDVM